MSESTPASLQVSAEERQARLQSAINNYVQNRYRVISQTNDTAQLEKPKRFSWGWFIAWTLLSLFTLIWLYPVYYLLRGSMNAYLAVDPFGTVMATIGNKTGPATEMVNTKTPGQIAGMIVGGIILVIVLFNLFVAIV